MAASVRVRMPWRARRCSCGEMPCTRASQSMVWMSRRPPGQVFRFGSRLLPACAFRCRCCNSSSLPSAKAVRSRCTSKSRHRRANSSWLPWSRRASRSDVSPVKSSAAPAHSSVTLPVFSEGFSPMSHRVCSQVSICCCCVSFKESAAAMPKSTSECGYISPRPKPPNASSASSPSGCICRHSAVTVWESRAVWSAKKRCGLRWRR